MLRRLPSVALIGFFILILPALASGVSIEIQRKQYQDAKKALKKGDLASFEKISDTLKDYPLYPYLRYNFLQPRLSKTNNDEISEFLTQYSDFPLTNSLRTQWLKHLAKTAQWQTYYANYTAQTDPVLQCNHLISRMKTNNHTLLLEDTRSMWLSGSSLPPECDPVFKLLQQSDLFTNDLVWQRMELAMQNNNTGLATYLSKFLNSDFKKWADNWIAVHNNPDKFTNNPKFEDTAIAREILIHGIYRLARQNISRAIENWHNLQTKYDFIPGERLEIDRVIAVRAARAKHPQTEELLDRIDTFHVNDDVFQLRLVTALENHDWEKLRKWTDGVPSHEDLKFRWYYWHARALEQTGEPEKAKRIYSSIANKRDYYGFLASDRLGINYSMEHKPLPDVPEEKEKIKNLPGIQRADELRAIGEKQQARREWNHVLLLMTSYQKEIAARLAADWEWHDVAIVSLGSAHSYDDLEVRFPIPYQILIDENANKRQLERGWVYALVRAESAFIEDIKSPAGALGLMQVMPATGKETAKRMGLKNFQVSQLLDAAKNVPIGSTYLKQMLDRYSGSMVLATAAYNAGPHRVNAWLPKNGCLDPDVWVEKIPFDETRAYVKRIMFFASIYDWRLNKEVMPLNQRMATITPSSVTLVANLSCEGPAVSQN
jgi:soluble lytic murein transglycosylase